MKRLALLAILALPASAQALPQPQVRRAALAYAATVSHKTPRLSCGSHACEVRQQLDGLWAGWRFGYRVYVYRQSDSLVAYSPLYAGSVSIRKG